MKYDVSTGIYLVWKKTVYQIFFRSIIIKPIFLKAACNCKSFSAVTVILISFNVVSVKHKMGRVTTKRVPFKTQPETILCYVIKTNSEVSAPCITDSFNLAFNTRDKAILVARPMLTPAAQISVCAYLVSSRAEFVHSWTYLASKAFASLLQYLATHILKRRYQIRKIHTDW